MKMYMIPILVLLVVCFNAEAKVGNGIDLDFAKIYGKLDVGYGNDDNIFLEESDEVEDSYFNILPWIELEMKFYGENRFYLNYKGDYYRYMDITDEDSESDTFATGFNYLGDLFYSRLGYLFTDTSNKNGILYTDRIERQTQDVFMTLGFDFTKLAFEAGYRVITREYDSLLYQSNDHDQNIVTGSFIYHMFSRTDFIIEYNYADLEYSRTARDGEYSQMQVGVKGKITPNLEGIIKAGYQTRDYSASSQEFDNPVFEVDLKANFSESIDLSIGYVQTAEESIIAGDNFYEYKRFYSDLSIKTFSGLFFGLNGYYEKDDFPESAVSHDRSDDVINLIGRVGYEFKNWIEVELNYDYLNRDSSLELNDYTRNRIIFYARFYV